MGLDWKETLQLGGAICGEIFDWTALHRLLVVQTGESASQANVFKAHAALQKRCL